MAAAYDSFDYPAYWLNREYEHKSEIFALREFFAKIHKVKNILEIGAGFGRLAQTYFFRGKKIILSDPSAKLLKIARTTYANKKNFVYIHSSLQNLKTKVRSRSMDLVILVRVIHHLDDLEGAFADINNLLVPNGYFIFEYPNKSHFKAVVKRVLKGDITYPLNIFTADIRSSKYGRSKTLPFLNYHPDKIEEILVNSGFKIVAKRSVSNLRSSWLKRVISIDILLFLERKLQDLFSHLNFGPSIFILARKVD